MIFSLWNSRINKDSDLTGFKPHLFLSKLYTHNQPESSQSEPQWVRYLMNYGTERGTSSINQMESDPAINRKQTINRK